jgi:ribosome-binding factor A
LKSLKPYNRTDRLGAQVLETLSEITLKHISLASLGLVTFTSVDLAPDLRTAKVFYSVLGRKKSKQIIDLELNKKRKAFKKYLSSKLKIRFTPDLKFYLDESFLYGERISKLINSL